MATTPYYDLNSRSSSLVPSISINHQKDYSRPLHVDCSVEYELPNAAKPPVGGRSEPLLMIHPCYYRRVENQRRCPFINNLPIRNTGLVQSNSRRNRVTNNNFLNQPQLNMSRHNHCLNQNHYPTNNVHNQCNIHHHPPVRYLEPILTPIKSVKNSNSDQYVNNNNNIALVESFNHSSSTDSGVWTDSERSPNINNNSDVTSNSYTNVPSVLSENFTNINKKNNASNNLNNNVINSNNNCEVQTNIGLPPTSATNSNRVSTRNNNNYHLITSIPQPYYQENEVLSGFTAYVSKISQRSQRSRRRFLDLGLPMLHSCDTMKPGLAMTVA
uniref:Centrosomal and chromosomal factor n=1 Tax=Cacopsylla melanoneura TaxID=428564 RepID=A0A8D8QM48_9HEMI